MHHQTSLAHRSLRHALALARATSPDELSALAKRAAAEITKSTPEPEPLLALLAAHERACRDRLAELAELQQQASADPLTGLRHYGPLTDRLAGHPLTGMAVLCIDVDRFKKLNDTHGHQAGDEALVNLAQALQAALRDTDELYRVGGDEFVALVEATSLDQAARIARRLCDAAERTGRTVSVGVAIATDGEPPQSVLRRADAALYEAKRAGRNTVHAADGPPTHTAA
ncbi:MAG TPA: GGDEF domain-containing protein [Natronosporangium sp.]